jgi:maleate isomerase
MTEWSRKLGLIVPSWNTVIEYEVWRLVPAGVSVHTARIPHTEDSEAAFVAMIEQAPNAVETLVHADVDAICYACTGGSFFRGAVYDQQLGLDLTAHAQRPVITMARAIVDAAQALGLQRIAVAAPYEQWLLDRLVEYLEASGFRVLNAHGLGQQANVAHTPDDALDLAEKGWHPHADGLVISCGNFPTLEMLETIEGRFDKPVVTSNQASVWSLLSSVDLPTLVPGGGQLLSGRFESRPTRGPVTRQGAP